ncbi:hypothetical protein LVJ94_05125 [Pendulispora rubella]|uniref:Uncharacterized protein n=1 Tax=Pendulispora rubella TaxID=2741070 RepID=A0ABZ2LBM4_9BACT
MEIETTDVEHRLDRHPGIVRAMDPRHRVHRTDPRFELVEIVHRYQIALVQDDVVRECHRCLHSSLSSRCVWTWLDFKPSDLCRHRGNILGGQPRPS